METREERQEYNKARGKFMYQAGYSMAEIKKAIDRLPWESEQARIMRAYIEFERQLCAIPWEPWNRR